MTEINPLHIKQCITYHTVWNVITTSRALVNLTIKKECKVPGRMLHKIWYCWVPSTAGDGPLCLQGNRTHSRPASLHSITEKVTGRGRLWGCVTGIFFNMTYEWERAATGKKKTMLAESNEREGCRRIRRKKGGDKGRRGESEKDENTNRSKLPEHQHLSP